MTYLKSEENCLVRSQTIYRFVTDVFSCLWPFSYKTEANFKLITVDSGVRNQCYRNIWNIHRHWSDGFDKQIVQGCPLVVTLKILLYGIFSSRDRCLHRQLFSECCRYLSRLTTARLVRIYSPRLSWYRHRLLTSHPLPTRSQPMFVFNCSFFSVHKLCSNI